MSFLNRVSCVPAGHRGLRTILSAYQLLIFIRQRAYKRAKLPYGVPMFYLAYQRAKRCAIFSSWRVNVPKSVPMFQTFLLRNGKGNLYALFYIKNSILYIIKLLYKKP